MTGKEATPGPDKLLLDPREAAEALSISPKTLWRWTFREKPSIPVVRIGRLTKYRPDDLRRWAESQASLAV